MPAPRPSCFALCALVLGLAGCCLCGCELSAGVGTNADAEYLSHSAILPTLPPPEHVASSTEARHGNEPMTAFERRRLMARVRQDPRTINRLTPQERRELAGMVAATEDED